MLLAFEDLITGRGVKNSLEILMRWDFVINGSSTGFYLSTERGSNWGNWRKLLKEVVFGLSHNEWVDIDGGLVSDSILRWRVQSGKLEKYRICLRLPEGEMGNKIWKWVWEGLDCYIKRLDIKEGIVLLYVLIVKRPGVCVEGASFLLPDPNL